MEQNFKIDLFKYLLKKEGGEGFSLIELVVVVSVLAVLSAIAIPSFICFPKKARATAALSALRQIKTECALNEAVGKSEIFTSSALNGYTIQTSGSNSCSGSNGVISALPDNTDELPTFNLATANGSLTYNFKGITGSNLARCLRFICDKTFNESKAQNLALKSSLETNSFVIPDTYVERECSAYVIVDGPTWEDAKNNARALGGDLASINDNDEHEWFATEFAKDKYSYDGDTNPGDPSNWINLWVGGEYNTQTGKWGWSSGQEFGSNGFEIVGDNDPGLGTGRGTDSFDPSTRSKMLAHFNHNKEENQHTRHGEGEGSYYVDATIGSSNDTRGIAEINTCN